MPRREPPEQCAVCGADIPRHARACPECGADERTGWDDADSADGLDLPQENDLAEAHRAFVREEVRGGLPDRPKQWFWAVVGLVLVIVLIVSLLYVR